MASYTYTGGAPEWLRKSVDDLDTSVYKYNIQGDNVDNLRQNVLEIIYSNDEKILGKVFKIYMDDGDKKESVKPLSSTKLKITGVSDSLAKYLCLDENKDMLVKMCEHLPTNYFSMAFVFAWLLPGYIFKKWYSHDDRTTPNEGANKITIHNIKSDTRVDLSEYAKARREIQAHLLKTTDGSIYKSIITLYEAMATKTKYTLNGKSYDFGELLKNVDMSIFDRRRGTSPRSASSGVRLLSYHECMHYQNKIYTSFDKGLEDALKLLMASKRVYLTGSQETLWVTDENIFKTAVGAKYEILCNVIDFVRGCCFMYMRSSSISTSDKSGEYGAKKGGVSRRPDATDIDNDMSDLRRISGGMSNAAENRF